MLRIRTILLACIAMTLCSVAPVEVAQAQTSPKKTTSAPSSVSVVASVDRDVVELGGIFEYKINVVTSDARDIRLVDAPDLRPFSVVGRSQRPQILIRNNVTERRLEVVYKLRTRRIDDKIVIKPPVIAIGDERVSPKPITIKVVKKGEAPKQERKVRDDSVYVETTLSLERQPYVGEQIVLQYDLFINSRKVEAQPQPPSEPSLDAFWIEELNDRTMGSRQLIRAGSTFLDKILLRRYAIYPLQAGEAVIDAMTVPVVTGGFMRSREQIEVKSKPITLDVQPLPPGAPDDFYDGNVGAWDFLVTSDALRTRVGRAVTIRLSAKGTGQVGRIKLPEIAEVKGARIGDSEQSTEQNIRNGKVVGEKLVSYAITPTEEGVLEIPALSFTYFDPNAGEYRTKQSSPIKIEVGQGELPPEPERREKPVSRAESSQSDVMSALRSELAGVHTRINLSEQAPLLEGGFEHSWAYRIVLALSMMLMCGVLLAPLGRRLSRRNSPEREREKLYREALGKLSKVPHGKQGYEELAGAIKLYCVEVLGLPRGHVSERELPKRLEALGVDGEPAKTLGEVLGKSARARYASDTTEDVDELAKQAHRAMRDVHRTLKPKLREKGGTSKSVLVLLAGLGAAITMGVAPVDVQAQPQPSQVTVESALKAHEARDWDTAIPQWQALTKRSPRNADVHYALGTAALQSEDLGLAVLSLERALLLRPKDRDIAKNLSIARRMVRVKAIESLRGRSQVIAGNDDFFWWDIARKTSGGTLALLLLVAVWGVILAALIRPRLKEDVARDLTGLAGIIALIVVVVTGVTWAFREHVMTTTHPVIVLEDRPTFRDGPSEHAAERQINSPVVSGSRHVMEEERKGWLKIRLPDGSSGWIEASRMGRVVSKK